MRKIIHIDMDAFFASVEQRDNPALKGKPVIVGGNPESRGVVAAASYEARKFGIHSAMPSARAKKLCPRAVFLRPRFDAYSEVSRQIREIFFEYTDLVEPLSLDEAYLDVTENKKGMASAIRIAQQIRKEIKARTGLTASAGVSFNKFLAKVASDVNKPDGITVITPEDADAFIDRLPIGRFYGIGKKTEAKMIELGISTGADLKRLTREELGHMFGKFGEYYFDIAHGRDDRPVRTDWVRKSIGKESTFAEDLSDREEMLAILEEIAGRVAASLERNEKEGRTVTLKVRYQDFVTITRSVTLDCPVKSARDIMECVRDLITKTEAGERKVRLLGITMSNFGDEEEAEPVPGQWIQLKLPF